MEKKLTKYFWVIILFTLVLVAFFMAEGTNELVAGTVVKIMPPPAPIFNVKIKTTRSKTSNYSNYSNGDIILTRNIFDSTAGELEEEEDLEEITATIDGELPLVQCNISGIKLLAMIASSNSPEWSFANLDVDGQKNLFRVGDAVKDRVVSNVGWRYLLLKGTRDECYIDMFDQDPNNRSRKVVKKTSRDSENDGEGIVSTGEYERTVERAIVDQALANPTKFAKSVRVRPYKKNGKVVGFRMRRVQRGSAISKLGAKRGDILHSVNGINLKSVDDALTAYQSLRSDDQLIFSITRKGKPIELKINIQ